jgi:hypothetical protein
MVSTEPPDTNAKKQRRFWQRPVTGRADARVGAKPAIVPYFRVASPLRGPAVRDDKPFARCD